MPEQRFRVTVGMPVYNSEKWIRSSLESWLNQTMADFRIVISDNGSTDESVKICSSIAANDSRIEIYKNKQNIGISRNFRRAFEVGSGAEYFMWASSHDYFAPTMLQRCVSTLDKHPDAVACCGQTALFESDPTNAKPYIETIRTESHSPVERYLSIVSGLRVNNLVHGVFRTNALRDTRLMGDYFSSDNVLVAQLALAGRIIQLPETLFYRRWEASASTSKMSEDERRKHWDPDNLGLCRNTYFKINLGYLRAVLGAKVSLHDKSRLLALTAKQIYWDRHGLLADVLHLFHARTYRKSAPLP